MNFQEYFMDLYLLAEMKTISLKITTVDMKKPPADFRSNFEVSKSFVMINLSAGIVHFKAAQPPILIDNGVAVLENDLIERHIMKKIPGGHNLFVPDQVETFDDVVIRLDAQYCRKLTKP